MIPPAGILRDAPAEKLEREMKVGALADLSKQAAPPAGVDGSGDRWLLSTR